MAMKKAKQPNPPAPAKRGGAAASMGKKAAAKGKKETSAKIRERANIKSGAGYLKSAENSKAGDLSGYGRPKFSEIGTVSFPGGRVSARQIKEDKRTGAYYLRDAKNLLTFESPYWLSKRTDLSEERTLQREKKAAKSADAKKVANAKKVAKNKK